jgi:hypothetical protein
MIDVSNATLEIIDAIKNNKVVKFKYHDVLRTIKPTGFYGDFYGFEGTKSEDASEFRRFSFDKITEWIGVPLTYKVFVELEMLDYPTDGEVSEKLYELLDSAEPLMYTIKPTTEL